MSRLPSRPIHQPNVCRRVRFAGIKIHDARMMRLMEVLLRGGTKRG
jgi:hypothetical protein